MTQKGYEWLINILEAHKAKGTLERIKQLTDFAHHEFKCSVGQLALAWCVKNPNVTTVLLGATKPEQLEENLASLEIVPRITDEHMARVDDILGNKPAPYQGWGGAGMRKIETI